LALAVLALAVLALAVLALATVPAIVDRTEANAQQRCFELRISIFEQPRNTRKATINQFPHNSGATGAKAWSTPKGTVASAKTANGIVALVHVYWLARYRLWRAKTNLHTSTCMVSWLEQYDG